MTSIDKHIETIINSLNNFKYHNAFKNMNLLIKELKKNNSEIDPHIIDARHEHDIILYFDLIKENLHNTSTTNNILSYILSYIRYKLDNQINKIIIFLNGLIQFIESETKIYNDMNININKTNIMNYTNANYLYGYISWLEAYELIIIKYECGKDCVGPMLKQNEKQCKDTLFASIDGNISGTGSQTIIFKNQSFFDMNYEFNYDLILRLLIKHIERGTLTRLDYENLIIINMKRVVELISIFIMTFRPILFTKLYSVPKPLDQTKNDEYYIKRSLTDFTLQFYNEIRKYFSKYRTQNEIAINKYLSNASHNNNLPHILSYITDIVCDANNSKINNIILPSCGSIKECFNEDTRIFSYDKYNILFLEHCGKNSLTLHDFIMQSWRSEITKEDIAGIFIQIAYTLYTMNFVLGIVHNDLHDKNIFIENFWRNRTNHYLIMFGDVIKHIYNHLKTQPNDDIFKDCREITQPEYEINEDGCKGILNVQSKYEIKIFDFDRAQIIYNNFNALTINNIKTLYQNPNSPYTKIYKHNIDQLVTEYQESNGKFLLYRKLDNALSNALYEENKKFGINNIFTFKKSVSSGALWGDISASLGLVECLPSQYHKYDLTTICLSIVKTIDKEFGGDVNRQQIIKSKWFEFLKYILIPNSPATNEYDYSIFYLGKSSNELKVDIGGKHKSNRSIINELCVTSISPIKILFDAFINESIIGQYFARKGKPTHEGIDHTKLYATHWKQFYRNQIIDYSTLYTPPDTNPEKVHRMLLKQLGNLNKIAPQLIYGEMVNKTKDEFIKRLNNFNGILTQY